MNVEMKMFCSGKIVIILFKKVWVVFFKENMVEFIMMRKNLW